MCNVLLILLLIVGFVGSLCCLVNVQDAQQQRLCTQEASILQMKQELLRASMTKEELINKNVRQSYTQVLHHVKTSQQSDNI